MDPQELKELPRSERLERVFGHKPTEYQAKLLDFGEQKQKAQAAPQAGRQVGKTITAGAIGADHALTHADTDVLYAAPSQGTANEMFRECKKLFWNADLTLEQFGVSDDNKETWEFENGTRILSRTLGNVEQEDNSGNRGMNPTCVIIDEAAYEKDAVYTEEIEEFFITHAEYEYYLFSTPAGKSGYFYEKASPDEDGIRDVDEALKTKFGWYAPYWPTRISPYAQQDYIEKKEEELDEATFAQEFLGEFAEDGDSAIPHSTLVPNIKPDPFRKPTDSRFLSIDPARKGSDEMVAFDMDEDGKYWNVWAFESMTGPVFLEFVHGVQTGERYDSGVEVPWNGPYPEPDTGTSQIPQAGYQSILIEENAVGGYGADFAEASLGGVVRVINQTNETKQNIYQRLTKDLESEVLCLPNHDKLIRQTTNLQKSFTPTGKAKYEHPPGGHDDWPDSLAMVNWARHGGGEQLDTKDTGRAQQATISF